MIMKPEPEVVPDPADGFEWGPVEGRVRWAALLAEFGWRDEPRVVDVVERVVVDVDVRLVARRVG